MFKKSFSLVLVFMVAFMLLLAFPAAIQAEGDHNDSNTSSNEESTQTEDTHSDEEDSHADEKDAQTEDAHADEEEDAHADEAEDAHADEAEDAHADEEEKAAIDIAKTTDRFLVVGGEAFVEALLNFIVAVLWLLLIALQLARPYFLLYIKKFGLRLGADLWWLSYVLIRDMVAIITLILSMFFFFPMLLEEQSFPIFGSVAATLILASLVVRLVKDPDDDPKAYLLETYLLGAGASLYLLSVILGVQAVKVPLLQPISKYLVTDSNTALAYPLLWLSMLSFVGIGTYAIMFVLRNAKTKEV